MAVKTQNFVIFTLCLLGITILIYEFAGRKKMKEVVLTKKIERVEDNEENLEDPKGDRKPCCRREENNLLGILTVNQQPVSSLTDLEKQLPFVGLGGLWKPLACTSPVKVAVIIPYRNRKEILLILLRHLHPLLNRQRLYYQVFVIEQSENNAFNKGKLQNIGFKEALKYDAFNCFIFHDVDMISEDDRNYYGCPTTPQHLSPSLDKFDYKMHSPHTVGGVVAFSKQDFIDVNGYSNSFYGVEGENENMISRLVEHNKKLHRPVLEVGRYTMLQHSGRLQKKEEGHPEQRDPLPHSNEDGLTHLRYKILHNDKYHLFTLIRVDLLWDKDEKVAF